MTETAEDKKWEIERQVQVGSTRLRDAIHLNTMRGFAADMRQRRAEKMRLLGNFDSDGRLVKLHLNPVESCNLDDADNVRKLKWWEAFWHIGDGSLADLADGGVGVSNLVIRDLLCDHCFGEDEE